MICPLLTKARIGGGVCDFPAQCTPRECFWARFHQLDAHTGKPLQAAPQHDLFDPTPTPAGEP